MPGLVDFDARQGTRFRRTITVAGVDLTGYGVRMQVRRRPVSDDALLDLELGDGIEIEGDAADGVFVVDVDADTMAEVPASSPRGWSHDIELIPSQDEAKAFALLAGRFVVGAEVTRADSGS